MGNLAGSFSDNIIGLYNILGIIPSHKLEVFIYKRELWGTHGSLQQIFQYDPRWMRIDQTGSWGDFSVVKRV